MGESADPPPVVGIGLCDSAPLVWRVEDLRSVRSRGLVGALLGSLPRTPRQNGRLGRPLLLLPEEERLLTDRQAAAALPPRNQDAGWAELQVELQKEEQQRSYEEQSVFALEDRKSALVRAMTSSQTVCDGGPAEHGEGGAIVLPRGAALPEGRLANQSAGRRAQRRQVPGVQRPEGAGLLHDLGGEVRRRLPGVSRRPAAFPRPLHRRRPVAGRAARPAGPPRRRSPRLQREEDGAALLAGAGRRRPVHLAAVERHGLKDVLHSGTLCRVGPTGTELRTKLFLLNRKQETGNGKTGNGKTGNGKMEKCENKIRKSNKTQ